MRPKARPRLTPLWVKYLCIKEHRSIHPNLSRQCAACWTVAWPLHSTRLICDWLGSARTRFGWSSWNTSPSGGISYVSLWLSPALRILARLRVTDSPSKKRQSLKKKGINIKNVNIATSEDFPLINKNSKQRISKTLQEYWSTNKWISISIPAPSHV